MTLLTSARILRIFGADMGLQCWQLDIGCENRT